MKRNHWKNYRLVAVLVILVLGLAGCAAKQTAPEQAAPEAKAANLTIVPAKTVLSPALIGKTPILISGSGFEAKEMVLVELVLPPGVTVKTVPPGENVGIANAYADENGNLSTKIGAIAVMNWFFQVGWKPGMKPDFKQASPLRPGIYEMLAEGMNSGAVGKATLELIPPPKKK